MAPDHEAVGPPGRMFGVKGDAPCALQQHGEHDPGLDAGQGCTDAVVDSSSECQMSSRHSPLEIDLVRSVELGGVPVGSAPQQQDRCPCRNVDRRRASCPWARSACGSGTEAPGVVLLRRTSGSARGPGGVGLAGRGCSARRRTALPSRLVVDSPPALSKRVEDDETFKVAEHSVADAPGDGTQKIVARRPSSPSRVDRRARSGSRHSGR